MTVNTQIFFFLPNQVTVLFNRYCLNESLYFFGPFQKILLESFMTFVLINLRISELNFYYCLTKFEENGKAKILEREVI